MSETPAVKEFVVQSNEHTPPLVFRMRDDRGNDLGLFHAHRKPRLDVVQAMAVAVQLDGNGHRKYDLTILHASMHEMLAEELYNAQTGEWEPCDDRQRFGQIVSSDRVTVPIEQLGEIIMWLLQETTGNPTGGSSPSSPGPEPTRRM